MKYRDFIIVKQSIIVILITICSFFILITYNVNENEIEKYQSAYFNLLNTIREPMFVEKYTLRTCNDLQKEKQSKFFEAARIRGCPPKNDKWLRIIHMVMPKAKHFVDIGANKGYTSISFFELWQPNLEITANKWYKKTGIGCGACGDCNSKLKPFVDDPCLNMRKSFISSDPNKNTGLLDIGKRLCDNEMTPIKIRAFDGSKELIDTMTTNKDKYVDLKDNVWDIKHSAFTDTCNEKFLRFNSDDEIGSINQNGDEIVSCKTVDSLGLEHVDILKIDTEGFDGKVILGAKNLIKSGFVSVIMFEYHDKWESGDFEKVMELLDQTQFSCYRLGKNYNIKLSGCITETIKKPFWSNVACFNTMIPTGRTLSNIFDLNSIAFK